MEMIRDYELVRQLGRGASATVWHAVHRGLKPCALKVFTGDATSAETRRMFQDEVRTAMSFSHGSVVQVFDAGEDAGRLWMACEWVDGVSLHAFNKILWERGGAWPIDLAAHVIGRLLVALIYIHEFTISGKPMHVVHRDVKPGNVLISAGGEIKLTDFGVSRMWHYDTHSSFRGTFRYVSLEHLRGHATQKSDLFGAGALLYELLTNGPFRGALESPADLCQAILGEEGPPELPRSLPTPLLVLARSLLAPAGERIASARDAHSVLARWTCYRPGEVGLGSFFREVMGRSARSGVTLHEGSDAPPSGPLPPRYQGSETYLLAPLAPEPDAPDAFRRLPPKTRVIKTVFSPQEDAAPSDASDGAAPEAAAPSAVVSGDDDSAPLRITPFFAKPRHSSAADTVSHSPAPLPPDPQSPDRGDA